MSELVLSGTYQGKAVTIRTTGKSTRFDAVGEGFSAWDEEIAFGKLRRLQVPVTADEQAAIRAMCEASCATATVAPKPVSRGIPARYAGTCAKSGQRYNRGAMIERTMFGWALVGAKLNVSYNMDREDSPL